MSDTRPSRDLAAAEAALSRELPGTLTASPVAMGFDGHGASNGALPNAYAGIVTRTIAFTLDVAIVDAAAALVGVTVGLGLSVLSVPSQVDTIVAAILGALWVAWSVGYFAFFWSTTGQTPGNRVMGIRVIDSRGRGPLKPRRAVLRFGGLCLAAIPLFAGFLMMLWDDRARCLQDHLARTVVVYTEGGKPPTSAVGRDLAARRAA